MPDAIRRFWRSYSRCRYASVSCADVKSAWRAGAVRLYRTADGAAGAVSGYVNAQDAILNFSPEKPLLPNTQYTFEVASGVITDWSGNKVSKSFTLTFTTAGG